MSEARRLSLTPAHIKKIHRVIPDLGPPPGREPMTDAEHWALTDELLAAPHGQGDIWVFAYGSLIWKPECATCEQRHARLKGWHRSFCIKLTAFRGTLEQPGLMMGLEAGGEVEGVIQRIAADGKREAVFRLVKREVPYRPPGQPPTWVEVESQGQRQMAFAFILRPNQSLFYQPGLSLDEKAEILASACGFGGTGAEYLMHTVQHLEDLGIHDPYLWALQERVAEKIAQRHF